MLTQLPRRLRLIVALIGLMLLAAARIPLKAQDFEYTYEGQTVTYTVIDAQAKTCATKKGNLKNQVAGNNVTGDLKLPEHPLNGDTQYTLVGIGEGSFMKNEQLNSVVMPNSVEYVSNSAFIHCTHLSSLKLSDSLSSIGISAFYGCYMLTSISLPNSLRIISEDAFSYCNLHYLTIPESVVAIESGAFRNCEKLTSVTIPYSVTYLSGKAFQFCKLEPLRLNTIAFDKTFFLESGSTIECVYYDKDSIKEFGNKAKIEPWNQYDGSSSTFTALNHGIKGTVKVDNYQGGQVELVVYTNISYDYDTPITKALRREEVARVKVSNNSDFLLKGLQEETPYLMKILVTADDGTVCCIRHYYFETRSDYCNLSYTATQTSISIDNVELMSDESAEEIVEKGIIYRYQAYKLENSPIVIKDLILGEKYNVTPYFVFKGQEEKKKFPEKELSTKGWEFTASKTVNPTSVNLTASFLEDGAKAEKVWWKFEGQEVDGKNLYAISLMPNTNYSATFYIKYKDSNYKAGTCDFKTAQLELKTLTPKCVSESCAIVAAETNISDIEPNVGFQWKKYDAPATLAPSEGYGAVCEGVLEGYIKNLQATSFYNVRPFYKDASGNYYYGEWVTFDPSDFSYFEPTVRTYPVQEVTNTSATVRGYALSGTDIIKRQGFQYWKNNGSNNAAMRVPADSEITTVEATGQIMTATLENLSDDTTYCFRAFAETDNGFCYGDVQTFTTEKTNGVENLVTPEEEVTIIGYFDLSGICHREPQRGFNIIVYSNGTTKKLFLR